MNIQLIYPQDALWKKWEPTLKMERRNVVAAIILSDQDELTGQVIVYHNPHHQIEGKPCIALGNLSVPNDKEVFKKIQQYAVQVANHEGASHIISPMNGSTWNDYRFVSFQSQPPFMLETTSDSHSRFQFAALGYKKYASYFSSSSNNIVTNWAKCKTKYQEFVDMGVSFEPFNITQPELEFFELAHFCNQAFRKNVLFSPIEPRDFVDKMKKTIPLIDPELTIVARMDSEIVGFIFAYEDLYNKEDKTIIVKTLARDIDKNLGGLGSILSALSMRAAEKKGFKKCIHALMINHNASTKVSANFDGKIISHYELLYYTI